MPTPSADLCGCLRECGDDGDIDGPGTCKGLPIMHEPLVEIVVVRRDSLTPDESQRGMEADHGNH